MLVWVICGGIMFVFSYCFGLFLAFWVSVCRFDLLLVLDLLCLPLCGLVVCFVIGFVFVFS